MAGIRCFGRKQLRSHKRLMIACLERQAFMDGYRDLKVYEKSFALVAEIYQFVKTLPKEETFGLSSQMRRAA